MALVMAAAAADWHHASVCRPVFQSLSSPQRPTLCYGLPRKAVGAPSHPGTACFLLTCVLGVPASLLTSLARSRNNIFPILGRPPYPIVGEECYEPRAAVWPARFASVRAHKRRGSAAGSPPQSCKGFVLAQGGVDFQKVPTPHPKKLFSLVP